MPKFNGIDPADYTSEDGTGFDGASFVADILDMVGDGDIAEFL